MVSASRRLTRRQYLRYSGEALGFVGLSLLAACGGGNGSAPTTTVPLSATVPTPPVPVATTAPTVALSTAPASASVVSGPTARPSVPAVAATTTRPGASPSAASSAPPATLFNGIVSGRQPDGFFTLGDPAATVALVDYSDFL